MPGSDDLTPEVLEVIHDARARAGQRAGRHERITEAVAALTFLAAAVALAVGFPGEPPAVATATWLLGLFFVLHQVEFDVGEGRTRPVQLVLVPMLLLLPPASVPLLIAAALVLGQVPRIATRRDTAHPLLPALADGWFSVAPALILATFGMPDGLWAAAAVLGLAICGQVVVDFASAALRLRLGLGLGVRDQLGGFAWVYLVDVLLTPVAVLAAVAGRDDPLFVAAVLPLAGLLAVFARERRGRIENALELHRLVTESEQRLQSLVQNSSDLIAIVSRDGTIQKLTGAVVSVFGPDWQAAHGTSLLDRVHPDDAALLRAFLDRVAADGPGGSQALDWRIRRSDDGYRYVETVATNLLGDERLEGIVLTARDVDERKAFEEQLRHRAFHDPLTQLANRGAVLRPHRARAVAGARDRRTASRCCSWISTTSRWSTTSSATRVGDELLVGVAHRLRGCLRSADTAARLGGDEFGVLLEAVAGTERAGAGRRAHPRPPSPSRSSCAASRCDVTAEHRRDREPAGRPERRRAAAPGGPRDVRGEAGRQAPVGSCTTATLERRARPA